MSDTLTSLTTTVRTSPGVPEGLTVSVNDTDYTNDQLSVSITQLPSDGTLTYVDPNTGAVVELTVGDTITVQELQSLIFTGSVAGAGSLSEMTFTISDPSGDLDDNYNEFMVAPLAGSALPVSVAENAAPVPLDISSPTSEDPYEIIVLEVPTDGTVLLGGNESGSVSASQILDTQELADLSFMPTPGDFNDFGNFVYRVEDTTTGLVDDTVVPMSIGPAIGNPVVTTPAAAVLDGTVPFLVQTVAATDPNYASALLTYTIITLPDAGTLTIQNGDGSQSLVTAGETLTADQFADLAFTPGLGNANIIVAFNYIVSDPSGNQTSATQTIDTIALPPEVLNAQPVTATENSGAVAIGIDAPISQVPGDDSLTITVTELPDDGTVSLSAADGGTAVTIGQQLTAEELTSLVFTPTAGAFDASGTFSYSVEDANGLQAPGSVSLQIGPAIGNPVASRGTVTTDANGAATLLHLPLAIDPNYAGTRLTYTIDALPTNGVLAVRTDDGSTQAVAVGEVLTFAQYADLVFTPTTGIGNSETSFTYTVTDPSGNATTATVSLDILEVPPVILGQPAVSVGINAADVALGIAAPTSQVVGNDALTVTLTALPTNGSVFLADGVTPVTVGEALSIDQLTSLVFSAGPNLFETDSTLSYMVVDADGVASNGTVAIDIGAASGDPSNGAPSGLTVAANSTNDPLGLSVPTDPSFTLDSLTVTITKLPDNGTLSIPSTNETTPVTVGQTITPAQLSQLVFTPTANTGSTTDFFGYTVSDPAGNTTPGEVTLTVDPLQPTSAVSIGGATTIAGSEGADSSKVIVNTDQPTIAGDQAAGVSVGLLNAAGDVIGGGSVNTDGSFTAVPNTPLGLGLTTIETQSEGYGGAIGLASTPLSLFVIQSQVNGISTTDNSSAQLGSLMDQGYSLQLSAGTEEVQLVDGTLSVGEDTNAALAQRLYEGLLGRSGDTAGTGFYTGLLDQGVSAGTVASNILGSAEYQAREGTTTDGQFVDILYQDILGRAPDASGSAFYSSLLQQGVSRGTVAADIANSTEAKTFLAGDTQDVWAPNANGTLLNELYNGAFDRTVDLGGLANYEDALQAGTTPLQIAQTLLSSAEGMADFQGQTDTQFVTSVFENALGRAPGAEGLAFYGGMLSSGTGTRADVLVDVSTSAEAATRLTHSL